MTSTAPTKTIWVTRDGERVRVKDMTDSHLLNTIRFLRRQRAISRDNELLCFPSFSGEMAQFYAEQDWDMLAESDLDDLLIAEIPTFETMLDEIQKRNLLLEDAKEY